MIQSERGTNIVVLVLKNGNVIFHYKAGSAFMDAVNRFLFSDSLGCGFFIASRGRHYFGLDLTNILFMRLLQNVSH